MSTGGRNYYDTLGVSPDAPIEEIRRAFRALALRYHPDVNESPDAAARFRAILDAYNVLSNPRSKADYDRLFRQRAAEGARSGGHRQRQGPPPPPGPVPNDESEDKGRGWGWVRGCGTRLVVAFLVLAGISLAVNVIQEFWPYSDASPSAATATPLRVTATPSSLSQLKATATPLAPQSSPVYGPASGTLLDNEDSYSPALDTGTSIKDSVVAATFTNNHASRGRPWSYGFLLRVRGDIFHALIIDSSGFWYHIVRKGGAEGEQELRSRHSTNINLGGVNRGPDPSNHVRVISHGDMGQLFINGHFEGTLDLSGILSSGSVVLVAAWFEGTEHPGRRTNYVNFSVAPATALAAVTQAITPTPAPSPPPDLEATVIAHVRATVEALMPTPTLTPIPTRTARPTHTPTYIPVPTRTPYPTRTPEPTRTPPTAGLSVADLVDRARPSVVRIVTSDGAGTGFVVDAAGHILTNEHVIDGEDRVTAVFDDGTRLSARVVAEDAVRDIALLKVQPSGSLTPLVFAASVREGEDVIALGYPLDLGRSMTITRGIVSAIRTMGGVEHVQTDAAINPGNSGGPLLNDRGEVVGMNTFEHRDAEGIGFAVSADVLRTRFAIMRGSTSPTATVVAQPTPTPTLRVTATPVAPRGFGPVSGELRHDEDDFVPHRNTWVRLTNSVIEATFVDTHTDAGRGWSHGFFFRKVDQLYYILTISSRGFWALDRRDNVPPYDAIDVQFGLSSNIQTGAGVENHVRVITLDDKGWLFINGVFESELDLSVVESAGTVSLIGVWFNGDERPGESTVYKDFSVRPIELAYGPEDGEIEHDPEDGFIDDHDSDTWLSDAIFEARFVNPYATSLGKWSSGFTFRHSASNEFHAIIIGDSQHWAHRLRTGDVDSTQRLAAQSSSHISVSPAGSNHIRILAFGGDGWLFINGAYVDKLDLSGWTKKGDLAAVGSYFSGHGVSGKSTKFERFAVWSIAELP